MQSRDAPQEFRQYVATKGHSLSALSPAETVDLMVGFFRDVPAEDCDPDIGGDALLFQWGTSEGDAGEYFEFHIGRQLFLSGAEPDASGVIEDADDYIWQLQLTLRWKPTPDLRALGSGDLYCGCVADVDEFAQSIRQSRVYDVVGARRDGEVGVRWGCAG